MTSPTRSIIGLDLGAHMGVSVWVDGELEYSEVWEWERKKGCLIPIERAQFRHDLNALLDMYSPLVVAYEKPHMRGFGATKSLMGWVNSIEEVCYGRVKVTSVHTGTLKLFATGRGNAEKKDMIKAARKYKPDVRDDNEADAILVGAWGVSLTAEHKLEAGHD